MTLLLKNIILNNKKQDIFIKENKIEKISENLNLPADEKIDGKGEKAVLPGLINCHTHAAMSLLRGQADDLPLDDWLKKIWALEKKLTEEDIYQGTKLACLEMIKTGTTCFDDMYWHPEAAVRAIEETGIRAIVGLTLLDSLPMGQKENIEKYWRIFKKKKFKTITFSIAPHSIYTVSKENLIWAKNFAKKNNLILHIHLSEVKKEVDDCLKKYKMSPVEYLDKIGFLSKNCILAHSIWLSDKEIKILKNRKCSVVYNPCSNMKLASGIFPYQKFKKARVNICLGTDGPASNNNLDLFEEMKFGALFQKISEMNPTIAPAQEIFKTATKNSAKALKINSGQIKKEKLADLILIDLNNICLASRHNLISNLPSTKINLVQDLIYSCSGNCVSDVICDGKILMWDRVLTQLQILKKQSTIIQLS
jgi:5-methylthioadenosine/S-adenosylhomocysteine deaminase